MERWHNVVDKAAKAAADAAADELIPETCVTLRIAYVDNSLRERGEGDLILLGYGPAEIDPDRAAYLVAEGAAAYGADA
jgi:hypothetical protein